MAGFDMLVYSVNITQHMTSIHMCTEKAHMGLQTGISVVFFHFFTRWGSLYFGPEHAPYNVATESQLLVASGSASGF